LGRLQRDLLVDTVKIWNVAGGSHGWNVKDAGEPEIAAEFRTMIRGLGTERLAQALQQPEVPAAVIHRMTFDSSLQLRAGTGWLGPPLNREQAATGTADHLNRPHGCTRLLNPQLQKLGHISALFSMFSMPSGQAGAVSSGVHFSLHGPGHSVLAPARNSSDSLRLAGDLGVSTNRAG
jgi:hypothetical protein